MIARREVGGSLEFEVRLISAELDRGVVDAGVERPGRDAHRGDRRAQLDLQKK